MAGAWIVGDDLGAADLNKLPGGWIGYAEITGDVNGFSGQADISGLTVTPTIGTTRRLKIQGYCRILQNTTSGVGEVYIVEAGANVQRSSFTRSASDVGMHHPTSIRTPSSGAITYKLAASVGSGTMDIKASPSQPAFILVQDIGPAS